MNKILIFSVLLVITVFLVSSCVTTTLEDPQLFSKLKTSAVTNPQGGSGGPTGIECYNDADCDMALSIKFCDNNNACIQHTPVSCINRQCIKGSPVITCEVCDYGCEMGNCIIPTEAATYEGVLNMLNKGCYDAGISWVQVWPARAEWENCNEICDALTNETNGEYGTFVCIDGVQEYDNFATINNTVVLQKQILYTNCYDQFYMGGIQGKVVCQCCAPDLDLSEFYPETSFSI